MKIRLRDGLPFVEVELKHEDRSIKLKNALLDTGSASTIISIDTALELGIGPSPDDRLFRIRGVGGSEYVYEKSIKEIDIETTKVSDLKVDVGAMNYGFDIDAILGMNFLISARLIIDMDKLTVYPAY